MRRRRVHGCLERGARLRPHLSRRFDAMRLLECLHGLRRRGAEERPGLDRLGERMRLPPGVQKRLQLDDAGSDVTLRERVALRLRRLLEAFDERVEPVPPVEPAVHLAPHALPVAAPRDVADPVVLEVAPEDPRRDLRLERQLGLLLERDSELLAVAAVVRAAGDLDEAAPVEADAVTGLEVAEVLASLVVLREVRVATEFVDGLERSHLR